LIPSPHPAPDRAPRLAPKRNLLPSGAVHWVATGEATPALGVVSAGVDQVMRVLWLLFTLSFPPFL